MAMLTVDGVPLSLDPAEMIWSLQAVNAADAGRDQSGTMHNNVVCYKRKLQCTWAIPHEAPTTEILNAVQPDMVRVTYFDPLDDRLETRTFYVGDKTAPYRSYQVPCVGGTTFKTLSLDFIEV